MAELTQKEKDIQMMLSASVHIGTKNVDYQMSQYVFQRKPDGIHLLNLGSTLEKLRLAARIIVTIENPEDVVVVASRTYGQRPVLKYCQHTGAYAVAGRFTPGTFTNQIQKNKFREPRLVIVTDPRVDHQAVTEASYANIPVIAFCDSDSPLRYVDLAIPANNKGKYSIGLMYWMLAREVLTMRGTVNAANPWTEIVDLFFYRDPEEIEKPAEESGLPAGGETSWSAGGAGGDWGAQAPSQDWGAEPVSDWSAPPADASWEAPVSHQYETAAQGWD